MQREVRSTGNKKRTAEGRGIGTEKRRRDEETESRRDGETEGNERRGDGETERRSGEANGEEAGADGQELIAQHSTKEGGPDISRPSRSCACGTRSVAGDHSILNVD
jgi:hypothetical protein